MQTDVAHLDMNGLRSKMFLEAENTLLQKKDANIYYLEAPTGGGKTNTSINLALKLVEQDRRLNNIFYIFPFNTLVEQTADTLEQYFKRDKEFAVVNSVTGVVEAKDEDENTDYGRTWLDRQFMHYPIIATSHINLFHALFDNSKDSNMLLARFCNSVVVIDEIQCYKNTIWRQIILLLESYSKLLNIRFIIMSATLPRLDSMLDTTIASFAPLLVSSRSYFGNRLFKERVRVDTSLLSCGEIDTDTLVKHAMEKYDRRRGKMLIELITKKTCREVYKKFVDEKFADRYGAGLVIELSGDDGKLSRKTAIEKIKSSKDIIVICTQVIEAGVDIDMDYGYKNISLLDGEEQFMGRINRSALKPDAEAFFFLIDKPEKVYKDDRRLMFSLRTPENERDLMEKNFAGYYDRVMKIIVEKSEAYNTQNILNFTGKLQELEFQHIAEFMRLIDNRQVQVYLAHELKILGQDGGEEKIIDGRKVFSQYRSICLNRDLPYAQRKVELSRLAEEMSYFTYNVETDFRRYLGELDCGYYYIDDGCELLDEEGKFDREKFKERVKGAFW